MSPKLGLLVAAPVALGLLAATPAHAYYYRHYGGGFGPGGIIAGTILGLGVGAAVAGAYAPPPVYYAPPPVYYAPPPVVYAAPPPAYGYPYYR